MQLYLRLPRFLRRPPRPSPAETVADGWVPAQAGGWHLSSFELRQGLDVIELDASPLAGLEAWVVPPGPPPQA